MTVMEALGWANNKLRKSDVDSPMLDAQLLLAFVLGISKTKLFSQFNDPLKTHQYERFCELIQRRACREPVAYLIGKKSFYGRDFEVNPHVLIPRPATETLIEGILQKLQDANKESTLITDIGTGSGAIAITLAAETQLPVIAIDIDPQALEVAKKNAKNLIPEHTVDFQCGNLAQPLISIFKTIQNQHIAHASAFPFKTLVIAANLPYLAESKMETLQPEVQKFEPRLALVAGIDGLDAYWELFRQIKTYRTLFPPELIVFIEIDPEQRRACEKFILRHFGEAEITVLTDLHGNDRVLQIQI